MGDSRLTLGSKTAVTTGLLAAFLILMASYGLHAISTINGSVEITINRTARQVALLGDLGEGVANMAAAQRGLAAFAYAKDAVQQSNARQLFQDSLSRVRTSTAEIQPLLNTEESKRVADDRSEERRVG